MIIVDDGNDDPDVHEFEEAEDTPVSRHRDVPPITTYMENYRRIKDKPTSKQLPAGLKEHHWTLLGNEQGPYTPGNRMYAP